MSKFPDIRYNHFHHYIHVTINIRKIALSEITNMPQIHACSQVDVSSTTQPLLSCCNQQFQFFNFIYYTAAPDIIGAVMINVDDATVVNDDDGDDDSVSFTLSWNEPFANFDPIVNYTVTINCTDNATCPVIVNTDNVTRTAFVNFITDLSMMTTLSVTATNTIGTSDPAITIITGKLCTYIHTYEHRYVCTVKPVNQDTLK